MLDEQGVQIFTVTDTIAEHARNVGGTTIGSIGHIHQIQRLLDNDVDYVSPHEILNEFAENTRQLTGALRAAHAVCKKHCDVAAKPISAADYWFRTSNKGPKMGWWGLATKQACGQAISLAEE